MARHKNRDISNEIIISGAMFLVAVFFGVLGDQDGYTRGYKTGRAESVTEIRVKESNSEIKARESLVRGGLCNYSKLVCRG